MMCELPGKAGGETPARIPPQTGEEQQSQPSLPARRGRQDPKELCSDSQMLKVTLDRRTDCPCSDGSHFPEFAAALRDEGMGDNIVGCVICDKYPRGFELRLEGAASPPSSFLESSQVQHNPSDREGSALPAAGYPQIC